VRVLVLHSRYLSGPVSGENRVVEDEARLLREAGHDVRVWSPSPEVSGALDRLRAAGSAVWSASAASTVRREVARHSVDVVHAHNVFPTLSPSVLRAAARSGAATLMTLHNFRLMCLPANFLRDGGVCEDCLGHVPWRGVVHRCYRGSAAGSSVLATSLGLHRAARTFDAVTRYLAVSRFVRDKHVEAGFPADRVVVKPNFAWPAPRRSGPGDYFLFLGRLTAEKGVDVLLRAWARRGSTGRLVIVGEGPDERALRRSAPNGVEFRGSVPPEAVPELLAGARALLLPSRWYEAAPRTITEAYAAGVPVLAARIGALPEAVSDGVTGYLAPPDDPEAWAGLAERLMDDRESERLGEGAWAAWSEWFTPEVGLRALEAAYRDAVAATQEGRHA
jgi:glycosyltransferase involved in cell wall biosynthesis